METLHSSRRSVLSPTNYFQSDAVAIVHPSTTSLEGRGNTFLDPWMDHPIWDLRRSVEAQSTVPLRPAFKECDLGDSMSNVHLLSATTVVPTTASGTAAAAEQMSRKEGDANSFHSVPKTHQLDAFWKGPYVPQKMYKDRSASRRKRLAQDAQLSESALFASIFSCGVSLDNSLDDEKLSLIGSQQQVLQENKCSISVRIEWPGYDSWSQQISTRDYCKPRKPITLAKFATKIKKVVRLFMEENKDMEMDVDADPQWNLRRFTVDDLVLVSAHHVSRGSWQPHLRLRFPLKMYPLY